MNTIKTNDIILSINENFTSTYKNATNFVNSGELWDFCIQTIQDPIKMSCIVFANDHEVPPVKSLLTYYKRIKNPSDDFQFTPQESQYMGALMGYVFKFVLGYDQKNQKERCKVNSVGVKTATRFLNGPIIQFQI